MGPWAAPRSPEVPQQIPLKADLKGLERGEARQRMRQIGDQLASNNLVFWGLYVDGVTGCASTYIGVAQDVYSLKHRLFISLTQ